MPGSPIAGGAGGLRNSVNRSREEQKPRPSPKRTDSVVDTLLMLDTNNLSFDEADEQKDAGKRTPCKDLDDVDIERDNTQRQMLGTGILKKMNIGAQLKGDLQRAV